MAPTPAPLGRNHLSACDDPQDSSWDDMDAAGDCDSDSDVEAYGGPCVLHLDPADPRSATFRPGVGDFLRSCVLERPGAGACALPAGPCAALLDGLPRLWASDLCGFLTVPADAVAANVVRWMEHFQVPRAAVRLGVVPGGSIEPAGWFVPRSGEVSADGTTTRPF